MSTPVLEGLKKKYPESHITFFTEKGFEGGILNNPYIDRLFLFDRKAIQDSVRKDEWKDTLNDMHQILKDLNGNTFNLIVNLSQHQYISYLVSLIDTESRYGQFFLKEGNHAIRDSWTQYLFAIPFARKYNSFHAVDIYRRIAQAPSHHGGYTISISKEEKEKARSYLTGIGVDVCSEKIIVLQPGAAFASKRWPAEHFIKLGQLLTQKGWQPILSGAPSEQELALKVQQGIGKNSFSTAGDTNFRQAIANLSLANGCVTGDTALMHASAALNVKTYALFGATSPVETGPYGDGHYIFSGDCPQNPCFNNRCETMCCMKVISPETVFSYIEGHTPPLQEGCGSYKTSLRENGDYSIGSSTPNAFSYYSAEGALLTKKALGEKSEHNNLQHEDPKKCYSESQETIAIISEMEQLLTDYIDKQNSLLISAFEKKKGALLQLPGIAQFWTALLNIRLNSVPLLNPLEGVKMSVQVCRTTKEQIKEAISSSHNSMS
jgi:heptosyltransferase-1/heptosyltransferase-2